MLTNALGKQSARLVNAGGSPLIFTFADISDPSLFLWPDDTPLSIAKHSTRNMSIALARSGTKTEYHFILRTNIGPDRPVTVRVPDLAALNAQQTAIARDVGEQIKVALSDPQQLKRFQEARADNKDVSSAVVQIARAEVSRQNPSLPTSAQWVLTADLLNSLNWPSLSAEALQRAESASPAVTHMTSVQYLAGLVAAQSGEKRVFANDTTPLLSSESVSTWQVLQPLAVQENLVLGGDIAQRMRDVPALKVFGLSLQGDVEKAEGNISGAREYFQEAATIRPSPSVVTRLRSLGVISGDDTGRVLPASAGEERTAFAPSLPPDQYKVGLNTYGIPVEHWETLEQPLNRLGYQGHHYSYAYPNRESWMASQPTVLYYRDSAIPAAKRLAYQMKQLTGESFVIQRGAGLWRGEGRGSYHSIRAHRSQLIA